MELPTLKGRPRP